MKRLAASLAEAVASVATIKAAALPSPAKFVGWPDWLADCGAGGSRMDQITASMRYWVRGAARRVRRPLHGCHRVASQASEAADVSCTLVPWRRASEAPRR